MTTTVEVLEYLRIFGKSTHRELKNFLKINPEAHYLYDQLRTLRKIGYIRAYKKKVIVSEHFGIPDKIEWIPIIGNQKLDKNQQYYYDLTPRALTILKRHNVKSFYDTPYAKELRRKLLSRPKPYARDFIKIEPKA